MKSNLKILSLNLIASQLFCAGVCLAIVMSAATSTAQSKAKVDKKNPSVFFIFPNDGETVSQKFKMVFGVSGYQVKKVGTSDPMTGHHHVIVNGSSIPKGVIIPADKTHIHYGAAQTEAEIELPPGKHTLTLQFADGLHQSFGPEMSQTITVNVK
jgi:hypothetical protein